MNIQDRAEALLADANCRYSVLCQGLNEAIPLISLNPVTVFSSASVIKVPILMTLFSLARIGVLRLEQVVNIKSVLDDTKVFEHGQRSASLRELAVWMTILSDNTSTNAIIDAMGFRAVNSFVKSLGLRHTLLQRKMLDFASRDAGIDNVTTANDMFLLYKYLFGAGRAAYAEAISILRRQRSYDNLVRYIWEDVTVAHKTGGLDYLSHDAGVFTFNNKDVYVGVFLWDTEDINGNPPLIGRIGRMIYDYYVYGG